MATTDKTTLKNWFKNKLKPTQEQFWAWMDSFWHKDESIPTSKIESLDTILNAKATTDELNNLSNQVADELNTMNQQLVLVNDELGGKVDVEEGKQLSTEDFTTLLKQKLEGIDMVTKLDRGNYAGTGEDLYNGIQNILAVLASDDTTLDELQEIVNYIKQNKSDLENLGIANIAGLQEALDAIVSNLSYSASATGGTVNNSNGTGLTIPLADDTNAGLLAPEEKALIKKESVSFLLSGSEGSKTMAYSIDGGLTWIQIPDIIGCFNDGYYNGDIWVAVGESGATANNGIAYSSDGINWTKVLTVDANINAIAWNGNIWVAVGNISGGTSIFYSYDGMEWFASEDPAATYSMIGICWNGSYFITGSSEYISTDGITWTSISSNFSVRTRAPMSVGNYTYMVGSGKVFRAIDVTGAWEMIDIPQLTSSYDMAYNGTGFLIAGSGNGYSGAYTEDFITFTYFTTGADMCFACVWADNKWIIAGYNSPYMYYSDNVATWTQVAYFNGYMQGIVSIDTPYSNPPYISGKSLIESELKAIKETLGVKVDKVAGKQLSTEDFTTTLKTKLEGIDMSVKLDTGGYIGTAQDLYDLTQNNYSGVILPTDGSTAMTRVGNADLSWLMKDVKLVLLADDLTEAETIADYDNPQIVAWADLTGASGQVMAKLPRVYYCEVLDGDGVLIRVEIAPVKLIGFSCHPKFVRPDGTEREFIYVGAYEASNSASNVLQSVSGVATLTSQTLDAFRTRAFARGEGWYPYDFWTQHLLQLLFYINYATFNSQQALPGYTERTAWNDAYKRNTGRSDALITMNGTVAADLTGLDADLNDANWRIAEKNIANRFLFVENIFGHIWKFMDGCAFNGLVSQTYNYAYVTNNPALFSSSEALILANYERYGTSLPGATNENYMQSLQAGFLPKAHGGSSSTYITDYFWSYLDDATRDYFRVVRAGGGLNSGGPAGVAARFSFSGLGLASSNYGSRLCAAP